MRSKNLLWLTSLCATVAVLTPGCTTTDEHGNTVPDPIKNQRLAASFKFAIANAVTLVVQNNPTSTTYFAQVAAVFCQAKEDGVINVSTIVSAVNAIPAPAGTPTEALITKNFIVGLFEVSMGSQWSIELDPQKPVGLVIAIVCDGISGGITGAGATSTQFDQWKQERDAYASRVRFDERMASLK